MEEKTIDTRSMGKPMKVFVSTIGACNLVFNIFIPIAVSLLSIKVFGFVGYKSIALLVLGIISSFYRAFEVAFLR